MPSPPTAPGRGSQFLSAEPWLVIAAIVVSVVLLSIGGATSNGPTRAAVGETQVGGNSTAGGATGGAAGTVVTGSSTTVPGAPAGGPDGHSPGAGPAAAAGGTPRTATVPGLGPSAPAPGPTGGHGPGSATTTSCAAGGPLEIGVTYQADLAAGQALVGHPENPYGSLSSDQIQAQDNQVFADINKRGGFAGCQIKPVYFGWYISRSDGQTQSQAECATFSQDNHVAFALASTFENFTLAECLAQAHVPVLWGSFEVPLLDDAILDRHPGLLYQLGIAADRMRPIIDRLAAAGYFDPGARLGVLRVDDGDGVGPALWQNVWAPELAALHINVAATYTVTNDPSASTASVLANSSSQMQAAVVQFKAAGVDHVLFMPGSGAFTFIPTAQAQEFHPRYGMTSDDQPVTNESFNSTSQLTNSVVVGWSPVEDGVPSDQWTNNASSQLCTTIGHDAGATGTGPGSAVEPLCDNLLLLAAAYADAPNLTWTGVAAGFAKLGSGWATGMGEGPTSFGPSRFDGLAATRTAVFDSAANTYRYTGPAQPLP